MASLKERLAKKRKELAQRGGSFKFIRFTEGNTRVRICSPGQEKDWAIESTVFFLGKKMGYVISPITFGGKCAVMNAYNELSSSKKTSDREFAKKFKPGKKYFAAGYKFKDEQGKEVDKETGIKPIMLVPGQYQDLIDLFLDDDEAGDFTDPENGFDVKMGRTGKGMTDTEYTVRPCKPTPAYKKYRAEVDLEELVKAITPSYKETKELIEDYLNLDPDEEDEKQPAKKKKKSKDL